MVAGDEHCQLRAAIEVLVPYTCSQMAKIVGLGVGTGHRCHIACCEVASGLAQPEVVPFVVEFEVAVPRLTPAVW